MHWLMQIPLPVRLVVVFIATAFVASLANAAIYGWAYNHRRRSAWQPAPPGVGPRTAFDRVPIAGWLRLRRDTSVLGERFWLRPLALEVLFPVAMTLLYWWEIDRHGLIEPQVPVVTPVDWVRLAGPLHAQFIAHVLLAAFMWIGTFIDIDEKTIPDAVTWPGTLLGLALLAFAPLAALPDVSPQPAPPRVGVALHTPQGAAVVGLAGQPLYVTPVQPFSPHPWPDVLAQPRDHRGLLLGMACWWFWGFAVADRYWPPKRLGRSNRASAKAAVWLARFRRHLLSFPLRNVLLAGTLLIAIVWFTGGAAWLGLLDGLIGLVLGGVLIWAVRVVGAAAMGREAMGFGDVTLMMMIGVFLGWQACLVVFFLAPFAGIVLGVLNLLLRRDDAIPYGPFLCLAAAYTVVSWATIWPRLEPLMAIGWLIPVMLAVCIVLLGVLLMLIQLVKRPFQ